jgi:hypothetical protein
MFPLPPEPLRWMVVKGLLSSLYRIDRKVDADIAQGNI